VASKKINVTAKGCGASAELSCNENSCCGVAVAAGWRRNENANVNNISNEMNRKYENNGSMKSQKKQSAD